MALASTGYFANFTLVDSGGNKSALRFALSEEDTIADAVTAAGTIATRLNAVTDAVILNYSVGEMYEEGADFLAAEGVHVENVALVSARIDQTEEKWAQLRIPAPNIGIFLAATGEKSNEVDPADAALQTYLSTFQTGGLAFISDGETLATVSTTGNVDGKRIHRASRKG